MTAIQPTETPSIIGNPAPSSEPYTATILREIPSSFGDALRDIAERTDRVFDRFLQSGAGWRSLDEIADVHRDLTTLHSEIMEHRPIEAPQEASSYYNGMFQMITIAEKHLEVLQESESHRPYFFSSFFIQFFQALARDHHIERRQSPKSSGLEILAIGDFKAVLKSFDAMDDKIAERRKRELRAISRVPPHPKIVEYGPIIFTQDKDGTISGDLTLEPIDYSIDESICRGNIVCIGNGNLRNLTLSVLGVIRDMNIKGYNFNDLKMSNLGIRKKMKDGVRDTLVFLDGESWTPRSRRAGARTYSHSAPEHTLERENPEFESSLTRFHPDIYSLGAMLYSELSPSHFFGAGLRWDSRTIDEIHAVMTRHELASEIERLHPSPAARKALHVLEGILTEEQLIAFLSYSERIAWFFPSINRAYTQWREFPVDKRIKRSVCERFFATENFRVVERRVREFPAHALTDDFLPPYLQTRSIKRRILTIFERAFSDVSERPRLKLHELQVFSIVASMSWRQFQTIRDIVPHFRIDPDFGARLRCYYLDRAHEGRYLLDFLERALDPDPFTRLSAENMASHPYLRGGESLEEWNDHFPKPDLDDMPLFAEPPSVCSRCIIS